MKAIKKNFKNLQVVARSIVDVHFSTGEFSISGEYSDLDSIFLVSQRDSIGSAVLEMIPCNYYYRIVFDGSLLKLHIWFE